MARYRQCPSTRQVRDGLKSRSQPRWRLSSHPNRNLCDSYHILQPSDPAKLPVGAVRASNRAERQVRIFPAIRSVCHSCTQSEQKAYSINWSDFHLAIPIAVTLSIGFCLLQDLSIGNLIKTGSASYSAAFVVGITASLSPCMAVVAGLALSMSAIFAKEGKKLKPQLLFHAGRLVSFFVLGGTIGAIGSTFAFTGGTAIILCLAIAIATLIAAANLLGASHWSKRIQPSMPTFLAQYAHGASKLYQVIPCVIGMATFFLPCVVTQSMQLYALSTGNFLSGALTMGSFALGTLPMLALVGFSPVAFRSRINMGVLAKSAGLIVIFVVLYNVTAFWHGFA